jgi:hypothetical protein
MKIHMSRMPTGSTRFCLISLSVTFKMQSIWPPKEIVHEISEDCAKSTIFVIAQPGSKREPMGESAFWIA